MRFPFFTKEESELSVAPLILERVVEPDTGRISYTHVDQANPPIVIEAAPEISQPSMPVMEPAQVTEIVRSVLTEEREKAVAEIKRMTYGDSPISGTPPQNPQSPLTPVGGAQYPIYAYDAPIDFATPMSPQRRPRSVVSLNTLRTLADTYDVLRACIQHLKREVISVPMKVIPKDEKDKSKKTQRQIRELEEFLSMSGGFGQPGKMRTVTECEIIEDLCVVGMAAVWYERTLGNRVLSAIAIDAATIRPNMDYFGWPGQGNEAYEQWVYGVMTARYSPDDLFFQGLATNSRSWNPFFASPVEWLISTLNTGIRSDDWNRRFFTDGSSVTSAYALPDTWNPEQIKAWSLFWDAYTAGDSAARQKTKWFPGGSKQVGFPNRKDQDFSQLDLQTLRRTCAIMGVQPASIGFAGEQYKVSQEDSMESTSAFGVGVILEFLDSYYGDLFKRMGYDRVKPCRVTAREEKSLERADRNTKLVGAGIKTPNEAREDEGLDPHPEGDVLLVSNILVPLSTAILPPQENPDDDPEPGTGGDDSAKNPGADTQNSDDGNNAATRVALGQWERKSINSLRRGATAIVPFRSDSINNFTASILQAEIKRAANIGDVQAIFRGLLTPTVYIIRHGETDMNVEHKVRSWDDPKLSKSGRKLVKCVGRYMAGKSLKCLKTSDLRRTDETAQAISDITGAEIVDRGHLWRPWDLGTLAGRFSADADPIVEIYARERPDQAPEHGESLHSFLNRFLPAFRAVLDHAADPQSAPGAVGIVSHGRNIKCVLAWLKAGAKDDNSIDLDEFLDYDVPMGAVFSVSLVGGKWVPHMVDVDKIDVPSMDDLEKGVK